MAKTDGRDELGQRYIKGFKTLYKSPKNGPWLQRLLKVSNLSRLLENAERTRLKIQKKVFKKHYEKDKWITPNPLSSDAGCAVLARGMGLDK